MEIVGIICEYNPFHNGHVYHINKVKELFPDSLLVLVLNGYFLERGDISVLTKEDKVKIALENNVDIVCELPFVFGSESADTFAEAGTIILKHLGVTKLVFGSECNDIQYLKEIAEKQLDTSFNIKIKQYLKEGVNYPTALNKAIGSNIDSPNDLLGISYIKSIIKNKLKIEPICIKRTNDFHDINSDEEIVSASNIREKIKNNISIKKYTNYGDKVVNIDEDLLFALLKIKILTDHNLSSYLTVDEGIENKLVKEISNVHTIDELVEKIKSKRYTYNRIKRMLIHILVGLTKNDRSNMYIEYVKILGFNNNGQKYLKSLKKDIVLDCKISDKYLSQRYELTAAKIYDMLTGLNTLEFELNNKPIKK